MATQKLILQLCGWLVGIPLEILVINALARGPYRRYPLVFFYMLASLVTTLVEIPLSLEALHTGIAQAKSFFARVYWINDWSMQILIFAMVLSLIVQATADSNSRRVMRVGLAGLVILAAGTSFSIRYRPSPTKFGVWMTPWTRDLSVCATVLDLALWMMLISSRKTDRRLLLISGALGMRFTGDAIGQAISSLSMARKVEALALTGSVIVMLADLAWLYFWWQTFRVARSSPPCQPPPK